MKEKLLHPATIIALIALFVALGGTSYAVSQLPKGSVGTKQLKKNAVTSSRVKNDSLLAEDFKAGQLPAGPQGPKGDTGARGPSDGYVGNRNPVPLLDLGPSFKTVATSGQLPAGSYTAVARANLIASGAGASGIVCSFGDDAVQAINLGANAKLPLAMASGFTLINPGAITMQCIDPSSGASVAQASVVATRVESLTIETTN